MIKPAEIKYARETGSDLRVAAPPHLRPSVHDPSPVRSKNSVPSEPVAAQCVDNKLHRRT